MRTGNDIRHGTHDNNHNYNHKLRYFFRRRDMRNNYVEFVVMDDASSDRDDGVIGTVFVPLAALADGDPVQGTYEIQSPGDRSDSFKAGSIHIRLQWQRPLQTGGIHHERALMEEDLRYLFKRFQPEGSAGVGFVEYPAFLKDALMNLSPAVKKTQDRLRDIIAVAQRRTTLREAFNEFERDRESLKKHFGEGSRTFAYPLTTKRCSDLCPSRL